MCVTRNWGTPAVEERKSYLYSGWPSARWARRNLNVLCGWPQARHRYESRVTMSSGRTYETYPSSRDRDFLPRPWALSLSCFRLYTLFPLVRSALLGVVSPSNSSLISRTLPFRSSPLSMSSGRMKEVWRTAGMTPASATVMECITSSSGLACRSSSPVDHRASMSATKSVASSFSRVY